MIEHPRNPDPAGPARRIVDAHHHIWLRETVPWLHGRRQPRIFGDYAPLQRDYTIDEFVADAAPSGICGSVFVQANVAAGGEVEEVRWAAREGQRKDLVQAVVGFADLSGPALSDVLDAQSEVSPLRGVRQQLHWHPRADFRYARRPDTMLTADFRGGLRVLEERGLHFELQVFPNQFADSLTLIREFPSLGFVLVHSGMPEDLSPGGRRTWARGLAEFADCDNVTTKISGLGTFRRRIVPDEWAFVIRTAVDAFGPDRCMFGSNFPIEKLWTDYASIVATMSGALSTYTDAERADIWHDTAAGFYDIHCHHDPASSGHDERKTP